MRNIFLITLFCLISCQEQTKQSNGYSETSRMSVRPDSTVINDTINFEKQDQSYIKYYSHGAINTQIKNVSYSVRYLNRDHDLREYVAKNTRLANYVNGQEGVDSKVRLDIYNMSNSELIRTIVKQADNIDISANFLQAAKYGCCGAENYYELFEIWRDYTFLTYNTKYYFVYIPNARMEFYFGYLADARNEEQLIHGELHFAHSYSRQDAAKEYKAISKVIFRAKTKAIFDKLVPFSPEITLLKNTEKDQIVEHEDNQELRLWSYNDQKNLEGIDFLALSLTFQDAITINIEIPIKDGFLFGDASLERTIYLEE